ncbi:MAG: phosphatase PAP2 family protein [Deltaproteobacteria bacterium]|nr:phosphatase PAP2 family protein [Deltaproteobacteria bacterium]
MRPRGLGGMTNPGGEQASGRRPAWRAFNAIDWLNIGYFAYLSLAIALRFERVPHAGWLLVAHAVYLGGMIVLALSTRRNSSTLLRFVRCFYQLFFITPIYRETEYLMRLYHDRWYDVLVVDFERWAFGLDLPLVLERIATPPLTELMKAFYASYFIIVPLVPLYLWVKGRHKAFYYTLFAGTAALYLCYVGFTVFPVQGPRYFLGAVPLDRAFPIPLEPNALGLAFQKPVLEGYLVTRLVDAIMHGADATGACIPSAHVAMSVVVLGVSARYLPRVYPIAFVVVSGIIAATVYNRYHYAVDAVTGILVGVVVLGVADRLFRRPGYEAYIRI